jgi:hypothetical protein
MVAMKPLIAPALGGGLRTHDDRTTAYRCPPSGRMVPSGDGPARTLALHEWVRVSPFVKRACRHAAILGNQRLITL